MAKRRSLHSLRVCIAFGVILAGCLFFLFASDGARPRTTFETDSSESAASSSIPWCEGDQCTKGRWEPRTPEVPSPELLEHESTFPNPARVSWRYCEPPPNPFRTEEERRVLGEQRSIDVAAWTWVPDFGKMKEWDAEEFVVRLLRSPGGLILVGDSISRQHFQTIAYALSQANISYETDLPSLPMFDHKNVEQHTLTKGSPSTDYLLDRAGVPASRLDRPILTFLQDHMLIGQREIREIAAQLGAPEEYPWYHDFQRVKGWEEFVREASLTRRGEENTVTEDTVLLLNGGAHWSRHELTMLPSRDSVAQEQARVKEAYRQMVTRISDRLSPISQLSLYYRSTSPGHPSCERSSEPYPSASIARLREQQVAQRLMNEVDSPNEKGDRSKWDWDLFPAHNGIWRRAVARMTNNRDSENGVGAKAFYLDVWDLSLQRPDAHNEPGGDCLHWCMPAVLNQWTYTLHHLLFLESNRADQL